MCFLFHIIDNLLAGHRINYADTRGWRNFEYRLGLASMLVLFYYQTTYFLKLVILLYNTQNIIIKYYIQTVLL